ncbi:MAG: leucine-rich repeat domain-containing protein [Ruminococcaceae bacterium]|nr:leucine-rich repeat domain-containing protein [Oscillospiraceae bacterium]
MKAKRIITLLLTLTVIAACFSGCKLSFTSTDPLDNSKFKLEKGEIAITGYTDRTTIKEYNIPAEYEIDGKSYPITKIADFGICNAESLTKITIGKNVKEIGSWAMTNNQRLVEFAVDPENEYFTAVDGVLFTKDMKTIVYYPPAKGVEFDKYGQVKLKKEKIKIGKDKEEVETYKDIPTYEIPDEVEEIAPKAFYKCYFLNITHFPKNLKTIGEKAFFQVYELLDFDMPETLEYIGKDAFAYVDKITKVKIGSNIKEIGDYAFFNCTRLNDIKINKKESDIKLGTKWQPTAKGRIRKECTVKFE